MKFCKNADMPPCAKVLLMSGKKKRGASSTASGPQPYVLHDIQRAYIIVNVTCGSLSENLYLCKLDE